MADARFDSLFLLVLNNASAHIPLQTIKNLERLHATYYITLKPGEGKGGARTLHAAFDNPSEL